MTIALTILGWVAWAFCVFLALSFVTGLRKYTRLAAPIDWITIVQALFWWIIAILFLFAPLSKLHIIWLLPLAFFAARFVVLLPIIRIIVLLAAGIFMKAALLGVDTARAKAMAELAQRTREKRALECQARTIMDKAAAHGRELTEESKREVDQLMLDVHDLDRAIKELHAMISSEETAHGEQNDET